MDENLIYRRGGFMFRSFLLTILFGFSVLFCDSRDCPDNFVPNPQFTGGVNQDECYPQDFVYYSSSRQGFYMFLEVVINDSQISGDDWVAAFNCEEWVDDLCITLGPCVGARRWGGCDGDPECDVPVLGDDFSDFCDGYMNEGDIPVFKIYDVSENTYIDATSSSYVGWYSSMTEVVDILYAYSSIDGCTDQFACNYDPYATDDNDSCEYCSCELDPQIIYNWDTNGDGVLDNYPDYEFNGSITSTVFSNNDIIVSSGDMLAAFVGDEQRGVANTGVGPIPFGPYAGEYMFQMMIYSNETSGETLTFQYYNSETNRIVCLLETTELIANMTEGDVTDPFIFSVTEDWLSADIMPENFRISAVYPNPFNPSVNIEFEVENPSNIIFKFYDIIGNQVDLINYGFTHSGIFDIVWSPELPSGSYFILMSDGKNIYKEKVTLIK